ncbi:MAG: terminase large subunit [Succinivibrionaceae bacterium]|nr:terminase large subunit [Succinivibrionaceae bacterium]
MNAILEYYQAIRDGSITAPRYVIRWYEIVVRGLEEKRWFYSAKRAAKAIRFVENFCHHHEGAMAPGLIVLELWQRAFLSVIFGVLDSAGHRQFREVFLEIGRKNGKTLLAAAIAEYMMVFDDEYGARVFFCAPKLDQAMLCYNAFFQMVMAEPEISAQCKKRRTDVYFAASNSSAQPIAFSAKKSDGLNPHLAVCDEIAAWIGDPGKKQYEVLKSALGARSQPMLLTISTAGYINDGIFDELHKRATAILAGTSKESRYAPFLYEIDDPEKWNDIAELAKSMPNLGVSVSVDYMLEEIAVAEGSFSKKAEFLCKYCNIKQNSSSAWFDAATINKVFGWNYTLEDFRDTYCLGGIDLSQTTDLTACCALIEREGIIWIFCKFFLPGEKLEEATARDGIAYSAMIERGLLQLSGDNFVDYQDCYRWFTDLIEKYQIYPLQIGYDRYTAQYLVQDMEQYGFHMESVFQGYNLTGVEDNLEGMMKNGQIRCADDNDLLKLHFVDAAQQMETGTSAHARKKLVKMSKNAHVDGVAAILDALCMRQSHWAELGDQLRNEG